MLSFSIIYETANYDRQRGTYLTDTRQLLINRQTLSVFDSTRHLVRNMNCTSFRPTSLSSAHSYIHASCFGEL
jgi:hypothetical protein